VKKHFIVEKQNINNDGFQPVKDCKSETEAETLIETRLSAIVRQNKKDQARFGSQWREPRSPVYRITIHYTA